MPTVPYSNELPKKYNPQNTSRDVLKNTFSIRLREYQKIFDDISQSTMEHPEQHYIIQGVRGAGKTTLLTRLLIAIEEDKKLSQWMIPIQFKEEEYGINSLFSLWLRVAEDVEEHHQHAGLFRNLSQEIESIDADEKTESEAAFKCINLRLNQHKKKIVLFIDNIVELFTHFTKTEKALLRETLSQNPNIRIIGGSAISLESFYDHKDPFYQFFNIVTLKALGKKDTRKLLTTLGKAAGEAEHKKIINTIQQYPHKIESIRRLTGGIPRTISLLFDILIDGPQGDTFKYLDHTLDMASPIYKHRMDDLTPQQKPIIHAIAKHWDAISAKEIAEKTRISSKTVSAQLAQLQKQWIIEKVPTGTKNHLYRLQERFFNIWYLMRYGRRRDKRKMRWLTQFLEIWCSPEEITNRTKQFSEQLHNNTYLPGAVIYTSALLGCNNIDLQQKEAVHQQTHDFLSQQGAHDLLKQLPDISSDEYYREGIKHYQAEQYEDAAAWFTKLFNKGESNAALALGVIYSENLSNYKKAEESYLQAIEHREYRAYFNLGNIYCNDLKDFDKAETAYLQAIEHQEYRAYLNLGLMYCDDLKDFDKAEVAYLRAIEHKVYSAYFNLGNMYCNDLKDFDKAEAAYLQAIEHQEYDAYFNLGVMYRNNLKDFDKAETAYLHAIEHEEYGAYINLGTMYCDDLKEFDKAETAYLNAIEHQEYRAYIILGIMYHNTLKDLDKAEAAYLSAIEHEDYRACFLLGDIYKEHLKDSDKAEKTFLQGINNNQLENLGTLALLYIGMGKQKAALDYAQQAVEHDRTFEPLHTLACVALWNNNIMLAKETTATILAETDEWQEGELQQSGLIDLLIVFLANKQTNLVDQWFAEYDLKDRFTPLYYALMHLMKDTYPNEYLRMGSEMEETVQEILAKIQELE